MVSPGYFESENEKTQNNDLLNGSNNHLEMKSN